MLTSTFLYDFQKMWFGVWFLHMILCMQPLLELVYSRLFLSVFALLRSVFVLPPSLGVLEDRLRKRATDSESEIERRLAKAEREMGRANRFDVVLINDDLETACGDLSSLAAEFLGPQRVEA